MKAILLVDDELGLIETLKDLLEAVGYRVEIAGNRREGLEALKQMRADLVITDLMMPLMSGKELLGEMRSDPNLASVPAILMSAARRQIAIPAGEDFPEFSTFLRKPFQLKPLMEAVVALIGPGG